MAQNIEMGPCRRDYEGFRGVFKTLLDGCNELLARLEHTREVTTHRTKRPSRMCASESERALQDLQQRGDPPRILCAARTPVPSVGSCRWCVQGQSRGSQFVNDQDNAPGARLRQWHHGRAALIEQVCVMESRRERRGLAWGGRLQLRSEDHSGRPAQHDITGAYMVAGIWAMSRSGDGTLLEIGSRQFLLWSAPIGAHGPIEYVPSVHRVASIGIPAPTAFIFSGNIANTWVEQ